MYKKFRFRTPFGSQRVNGSQILQKSAPENVLAIVSLFRDKLSSKTSLIVRSEILGLFFNTVTADDKYPCHNRKNIAQSIRMQLSNKPKTFFKISIGTYIKF